MTSWKYFELQSNIERNYWNNVISIIEDYAASQLGNLMKYLECHWLIVI